MLKHDPHLIARILRRLAKEGGFRSIAGRLKESSVYEIARRMSYEMVDISEPNVILYLNNFSRQHSQHFNTNAEQDRVLRKTWREITGATDDARAIWSKMTKKEKLDFANTGLLPDFVDETNDDE